VPHKIKLTGESKFRTSQKITPSNLISFTISISGSRVTSSTIHGLGWWKTNSLVLVKFMMEGMDLIVQLKKLAPATSKPVAINSQQETLLELCSRYLLNTQSLNAVVKINRFIM
jgi:hypothetical protein